jgi:hypothetical protein
VGVYQQWRTKIRTLVLRHCTSKMNPDPEHDEPIKIGTHTLRKTGYLFSVFGVMRYNGVNMSDRTRNVENSTANLQMANILKSARHATVQNASVYLQDIGTMYEAIQKERNPHVHRVGEWCSIFIRDIRTFRSISTGSHLRRKNLPTLAAHFVLEKHQVPTDGTMIISQVLALVLNEVLQRDSVASLTDAFNRECSVSVANQFKLQLEGLVHEITVQVRKETIAALNHLPDNLFSSIYARC